MVRMKLKLRVLIFVAIIASFTVISVDTSSSGDQKFDGAFNKVMEDLQKKIASGELRPPQSHLLTICMRSIDTKCMRETQELHKFKDIYIELANKISDWKSLTEIQKNEFISIQVLTSFRCSNKLKPISRFIFDFVQSFGPIVRAFVNETELVEYKNELKCANNYAVKKKLWDIVKYPVEYELNVNELAKCDAEITQFKAEIQRITFNHLNTNKECMKQAVEDTIDSLLKVVLLMQVEMTSEQRNQEVERFHGGIIELYDRRVTCAHNFITTDKNV